MVRVVFRSFFLWANLLVAILLVLSYFATQWDPANVSGFGAALLGLGYPILLLLNIFFILFWLFFRKWFFIISILVIALGWPHLQRTIHIPLSKQEIVPTPNEIKFMSYNVQNFDLYNWTENEVSRNNMLNLIKEEEPDVIAFQEFYTEDSEHFHNVKLLVNELDFQHYYFEKTLTLKEKNHWGLAVFSKYPLTNKTAIPLKGSKNNLITFCDIEVPNSGPIRLFNVHLQSIGLGNKDFKYLKEIADQKPDSESSKNLVRIVKKLKTAFGKRGDQAEILGEEIRRSGRPVVVCGDFNDTPMSYTYHEISNGLKDAFMEQGVGLGGTYAGPLPSFRIDYILTDPVFEVHDFEVIRKKYSDHYPITAVIGY